MNPGYAKNGDTMINRIPDIVQRLVTDLHPTVHGVRVQSCVYMCGVLRCPHFRVCKFAYKVNVSYCLEEPYCFGLRSEVTIGQMQKNWLNLPSVCEMGEISPFQK